MGVVTTAAPRCSYKAIELPPLRNYPLQGMLNTHYRCAGGTRRRDRDTQVARCHTCDCASKYNRRTHRCDQSGSFDGLDKFDQSKERSSSTCAGAVLDRSTWTGFYLSKADPARAIVLPALCTRGASRSAVGCAHERQRDEGGAWRTHSPCGKGR